MRIIFMGTPEFAVPCLDSLINAGHDVCAVFTQPDKPKGRGYALTPPPVKELAVQKNIPVFQPTTLKNEESFEMIQKLKPECIVVVAYGKLLPKNILDIPEKGCINVHASLLPKYRGAAPIQWAVIDGEKITGVTTQCMAEGLDTGDILLKSETEIGENETSGELHDRLSEMGAKLIVETLTKLQAGEIKPIPQGEAQTHYASMLNKEIAKIDWNHSAQEIHNLVRGLSPWPVAYTNFKNKKLKVHKTAIVLGYHGKAGQIINNHKSFLVYCGENTALELLTVQLEGGKRMSGSDFLRGHSIDGDTFLD